QVGRRGRRGVARRAPAEDGEAHGRSLVGAPARYGRVVRTGLRVRTRVRSGTGRRTGAPSPCGRSAGSVARLRRARRRIGPAGERGVGSGAGPPPPPPPPPSSSQP